MSDDTTDASELDLLRDSARKALSRFPEALGLAHGGPLAPAAVADAAAIAAEQGWTGMLLPEELGGLGLGMRAAVVVAEEIGRALAPGPWLANVVLLPTLAATGGPAWLSTLAGEVAGGGARAAFGLTDAGDGPAARCFAEHGFGADVVLRLHVARDAAAETLVVWRLDTPGLRPLDPFDPTCPVAELDAGGPPPDAVRLEGEAGAVLGAAQIWIAAEMLGAAHRAGAMSVAYAGERRQFGGPIGAYQAVKHRIVDDYVLRQNAAALVAEAALAWDAGRGDRLLLAHAARAAATQAATASTAHCIQVHGAIGFSTESGVHLAYKRVRRLACTMGDEARSRALIARHLVSDPGFAA